MTKSDTHNSNDMLDLPPKLLRRHVHPTFHISKLRPYRPNNDILFLGREAQVYYDFGEDPETEWLVDTTASSDSITYYCTSHDSEVYFQKQSTTSLYYY